MKIDDVKIGQQVQFYFVDERAFDFAKLVNKSEDLAIFESTDEQGHNYEWEAYKVDGEWFYGVIEPAHLWIVEYGERE